MNIENLAKRLGTDNLEQFIIDEYTKGKEEAELVLLDSFLNINEELNKIESEETKIVNILTLIITLKRPIDFSYNNELHLIKTKAKDFASNNSIDITTEKEELRNFANYYLAFFKFQNTPHWLVLHKLKELRNSSITFHLQTGIVSRLSYYFDILNDIYKIDSFTWSWENFEDGLIKVFQKFNFDKMDSEIKHEAEIEILNHRTDNKIDVLKTDIRNLEGEISRLKEEIELRANFHDKYYYKNETVINNTFFGDNQPFIFNLYNFLKRNNLFHYSWSYFYSCMIVGNKEIIPLESKKNLKFIGRIFYNLRFFLVSHYKDEYEHFFRSKFFINTEPLPLHFFSNQVYRKLDIELTPFIAEVDDFFNEQKKTYLKS